ncbi:MAG: hypothetical protein K2L64_02915, partial [Ureaplasma sp.]|nr:hypothetical protein [Ureaplasma sp.]
MGLFGIIASIATPIVMSNKMNYQPTLISFVYSDFINLGHKIIEKVNLDKLTKSQFESIMLNFFKANLKASNTNIYNIIVNIQLLESTNSITTFKVALKSDTNKYNYVYNDSNMNIYIDNNILTITYSGNDAIIFN